MKTLSYNYDNKLLKHVEFSHWLELNNYSYPMNLSIRENYKVSDYSFTDLKFLKEIPDTVKIKFNIPEDCVVHEYKW